ncbi:TonB-dependent receptor plug domain-containing protein [Reichenbachiella agariperforans]|uniref:TonB-dependent receptor plug domain-containing protein n=1 Tax=Reichenbachiella agariperforans TaxID=156994 RepID=UPI001C0983CF|nr:TonB-dependent receptor plug domain-containing protein [Reichenbachiella agariperforans]MBU2915375.1 TonB-dependent receptor plug domain-containing protein [Reichenbachiella agariperforans]
MYRRGIWGALLGALIYFNSGAQTAKQRLEEIIDRYESDLEIKFSYDPELVSLVSKQYAYQEDLESFITKVEQQLPFEFVALDSGYYAFRPVTSSFVLYPYDSVEQESIAPSDVMVLLNGEPIPVSYLPNGVRFEYRPNLSDSLMLYVLGYDKKALSVAGLINQREQRLSMFYVAVELDGLVIQDYITTGIDVNPSSQRIAIAVDDLPLLPGETDGDIFASIAALPGVTSPDKRAGNLFIRGSFTDQSLFLFDDIPIYHRGHYYGTISPYNPKVVSEVEVYRSGLHPRLGDRVGGAVVIRSDDELPNQAHAGLGANTLYATAYGRAEVIENKLGISVGARRSYPREFQSPKLNAISKSVFSGTGVVGADGELVTDVDVTFEDYHSKLNYQINEKNSLSTALIYTNTDVYYESDGTDGIRRNADENQFQNYGVNFKWCRKLSNKWKLELSTTYSDYAFKYIVDPNQSGDSTFYANNTLKDYLARYEMNRKSRLYNLDVGLDYKYQTVGIDYADLTRFTQKLLKIDKTVTAHSVSPYANLDWHAWERWYVQVGMRATYYQPLETVYWEPRLFVNYDLTSSLVLKGSVGWYHQYLSQMKNLEYGGGGFDNELWVLADGDQGYTITGIQSSVGGVLHQNGWVVDVEGYYKQTDGVSVYQDRRLDFGIKPTQAGQSIAGIDFLIKKAVTNDLTIWASYTYSQSKVVMDTAREIEYTSKYVQPHVVYLGGAYTHDRWKFSGSWTWSSGLFAKSLDMVYAENVYFNNTGNLPPPGSGGAGQDQNPPPRPPNPFADVSGRYDPMHSLDLSASYHIPRTQAHRWAASFGLSLVNVYNQVNLIDKVYRGAPQPSFLDRYAIGFAPNLMVMVEW